MKLTKRIFLLNLILLPLAGSVCAQSGQIKVPRIEMMPNQPAPFNMLNWKRVAQQYDSFAYNINQSGQYLPLVSLGSSGINYPQNKTIQLNSYVGTNSPGGSEAINVLPSLVGASLNGIDKSNQYGQNWLSLSQDFFNKANGEKIYLNNAGAGSGSDGWYDVMPNVFFYQLYHLYPSPGSEANLQFTTIADRFLQAIKAMGGNDTPWAVPNMNYRAWNFKTMQGNANGVKEPEGSGAYAWIMYHAYQRTGNREYLKGAEWATEFLNNYPTNPSYELQLPYGTLIAATMNAELGTTYNIEKMVNWSFNKGPLRNWGTLVGTWGGFDVSGLVGEANDAGNDYAFQLNGVQQAAALLPMVRYDKRFARAIAKWILNLANATRLFYPGYLPNQLQDASVWSNANDPNHIIGYEALRQQLNGLSPVSTGDALKSGWAGTNLSLYSTSSIGYLGALVEPTAVEKIVKLDLVKTDFFHAAAYPSYVLYNSYNTVQTVQIDVGNTPVDIYDVLSESFIAQNKTGITTISIPADQAVSIVLVPVNATVTYDHNKMLLNNIIVDYSQSKHGYTRPVRIKALAAKSFVLQVGDSTTIYVTAVDPDNAPIKYSWSSTAGIIHGNGDTIQWIAPNAEGKSTLKVLATDDQGNSDSASLVLTVVTKINLAPQISSIGKAVSYTGTNTSLPLNCVASDPNGDALIYAWSATGGSFNNPASTSVNWISPGQEGIYTITVKVMDSGNLSATASASILVKNFNSTSGKLIAYYPFNANANDVSGNQLNGEASGTVFVPDKNGKMESACYFNGGAQHITVNNDPKLNVQEAITVSCWFDAARLPDKETFLLSHGSWQNRWKLSLTPEKKLRWTVNTLNAIVDLDSPDSFITDSFYHVSASFDGAFMTLYLNGTLIAFKALSGKIRPTTLPFLMGQMLPEVTDYNFKGVIDEVKLYDYAFTPGTAASLYAESTTALKNNSPHTPQYLNISPNPVSDYLFIGYPATWNTTAQVYISDINGRITYASGSKLPPAYIDVRLFSPGLYIIMLQSLQQTCMARFIKI